MIRWFLRAMVNVTDTFPSLLSLSDAHSFCSVWLKHVSYMFIGFQMVLESPGSCVRYLRSITTHGL